MHWFNNKWTNNFSGSYVNEFRTFITLVQIIDTKMKTTQDKYFLW